MHRRQAMQKTSQIHVRLSPDQHDTIKKAAEAKGISMSTFMRWASIEAAKAEST
jgi:uncharacterized protein (DUF1778 family)